MFIDSASALGVRMGMSPFVIGVLIVGMGTSLPEFASSIAAVLSDAPEIVVANVVGSNITNILLIVGLMALLSHRVITIRRDLLRTELPLFVIATTHFVFIISDGVITRLEALLLLGTFAAYLWYIISEPSNADEFEGQDDAKAAHARLSWTLVFLVVGLGAVVAGAHFTVASAIMIATILEIPLGIVSILGIAIGTSLPELVVSLQALKTGAADLAIGNIFGSNAMNMLFVAGFPALFWTLQADEVVMGIGIHILVAASVIFLIHGLSRRLMRWEGLMLLLFFVFFVIQLFTFI
jgi:cation:H+ antiporter